MNRRGRGSQPYAIFSSIRAAAEPLRYVRDVPMMTETLAGAEHILSASVQQIDLGTGRAVVSVASLRYNRDE